MIVIIIRLYMRRNCLWYTHWILRVFGFLKFDLSDRRNRVWFVESFAKYKFSAFIEYTWKTMFMYLKRICLNLRQNAPREFIRIESKKKIWSLPPGTAFIHRLLKYDFLVAVLAAVNSVPLFRERVRARSRFRSKAVKYRAIVSHRFCIASNAIGKLKLVFNEIHWSYTHAVWRLIAIRD